MKIFLSILLFFISSSTFAQISFQSGFGTPNWKSVTVLMDSKNPEKSIFYYSASDYSPTLLTPVRDTTVSGLQLIVVTMPNQKKPYFLAVSKDFSRCVFFDQSLRPIANFINDSNLFNQQVAANVKGKTTPDISTSDIITLFKLFAPLLIP
ncbi:hypothetical protein [Mucilaginibacter ginkgonis]|uniref:Uncharacterized protein n=1 Tax=Mucilaginibacter ginkgonis TaxID=2682091 RepID=A0A6I4HXP0_9SPHI|nr:hypothetical protein [Mucilaginibacter ginkgonis]QQL51099.1 hypothetical protein GO620_006515 [Mucilaginibacter ginkgonis]